MSDIRSLQNIAQVEWTVLNTIRVFQTVTQIEYVATLNELERLVDITSTVTETDLLQKFETGLSVSITTTISDTDLQAYIDADLLISSLAAVSVTDTYPIDESYKLVNLNFTITETDLQDSIESEEVALSLTITETSRQDFIDDGITVATFLTVSVFDSIPCDESYLQVAITSTISETDNFTQIENVAIQTSLTITETDSYIQVDELLLLLNASVSIFDSFEEKLLVLANIEVTNISGYPTGARKIFELIGRHE